MGLSFWRSSFLHDRNFPMDLVLALALALALALTLALIRNF